MTLDMTVVHGTGHSQSVGRERAMTVMTDMTVVPATWRVANSVHPSYGQGQRSLCHPPPPAGSGLTAEADRTIRVEMMANSSAGRGGTTIPWGGAPLNALENCLTCATTASIPLSLNRSRKYGIALAGSPLATICFTSSSVGGCPCGVDLNLNSPSVKSRRGRGISDGAASVRSGKRHIAAQRHVRPEACWGGKSAPGGHVRSA